MAEVSREYHTPRLIPYVDGLNNSSMAGNDVKAELSGRRDRAVVHICESGGQLDGICRLFSDVSTLGEEEVGV
jgi:hypothetical protein